MNEKIIKKIINLEKRIKWRQNLLKEFTKHQKDKIRKLNQKIKELRKLL